MFGMIIGAARRAAARGGGPHLSSAARTPYLFPGDGTHVAPLTAAALLSPAATAMPGIPERSDP
jgi:hypothetical protein